MKHLVLATLVALVAAIADADPPCTVHSATTNNFFDLRTISLKPKDPLKAKPADLVSYPVRGYDYGANFTINFCAPVRENLTDVVGVDKAHWGNVSAFYQRDGKTYSIGQQSGNPVFRGSKLVLNYTDGSPCGFKNDTSPTGTKSSIFSFLCERDSTAPEVAISFVGTSRAECAYFFEVRTSAACGGGLEQNNNTLSAGGVFGVIMFIVLLVYLLGGCVYNRTVMHARGWRQLPNYEIWSGIWSFVSDMFFILTASCARCLPIRRGYQSIPRGRNTEDENRLIDDLDEEWGD